MTQRESSFHVVQARTAGEAWCEQLALVMEQGVEVPDGNQVLREVLNVLCVVDSPAEVDPVVRRFGDPAMIDMMRRNFLETEPLEQFGYSYGQRMHDFDGVNQLERVVETLRTRPSAKSATLTLTRPGRDDLHHPCVNVLDFKLRKGSLQLASFFRSQDVGRKLYADVIALGELLQRVAGRVGCPAGGLVVLCASSHIYREDEGRASQILAAQGRR
jgi:thymidylate synthase